MLFREAVRFLFRGDFSRVVDICLDVGAEVVILGGRGRDGFRVFFDLCVLRRNGV